MQLESMRLVRERAGLWRAVGWPWCGIENRVYNIAATATKFCPQLDGVGNYLLRAVRPIGTGLRGEPLDGFAHTPPMIAAIQSWIDMGEREGAEVNFFCRRTRTAF